MCAPSLSPSFISMFSIAFKFVATLYEKSFSRHANAEMNSTYIISCFYQTFSTFFPSKKDSRNPRLTLFANNLLYFCSELIRAQKTIISKYKLETNWLFSVRCIYYTNTIQHFNSKWISWKFVLYFKRIAKFFKKSYKFLV